MGNRWDTGDMLAQYFLDREQALLAHVDRMEPEKILECNPVLEGGKLAEEARPETLTLDLEHVEKLADHGLVGGKESTISFRVPVVGDLILLESGSDPLPTGVSPWRVDRGGTILVLAYSAASYDAAAIRAKYEDDIVVIRATVAARERDAADLVFALAKKLTTRIEARQEMIERDRRLLEELG